MQVVPNQLVELYLENYSEQQFFRTRVEDAYDDLLIIGAPLQQGHIVPIRVGTRLDIEFKRQDGLQEGRFSNRAIVEKRFTTNIPLLQLRLLGTWEKTQERMFVRVPVHLEAMIVVSLDDGEKSPPETGVILNLSGGGFLLRASRRFELYDEVEVSFRLLTELINAQASMTRFVPTDQGDDFGFAFLELPEQARKAIIQFVYKRQIELAEIAKENKT